MTNKASRTAARLAPGRTRGCRLIAAPVTDLRERDCCRGDHPSQACIATQCDHAGMTGRSPSTGSRVTMADVARACGVSVMTVSYALNRPERVAAETRTRVLRTARRLGYSGPDPRARSLRLRISDCLGVVLGEQLRYAFEDPMVTRFLSGISHELIHTGQALTIISTASGEQDSHRISAAAVDAFVVWSTTTDDPALHAAIATGRPVVVQGGPQLPGVHCVSSNDRTAARAITEVAFVGSRRPAVLSFPMTQERRPSLGYGFDPESATYRVTRERLRGIADYCEARKIANDELLVCVASRNDEEHGRQAAQSLLAQRPDAVMAMSDELARIVLEEAAQMGLGAPNDLAVTGWDDGPASARLGLTTVNNDLRGQGATCARLALGIQTENPPIPWQIVTRTTTRSPAN